MPTLPVIKGYKIHKVVGKGGMATVYSALDLKTKKIVAIKILHSHVEEENQAKERFLKEASLSLSLQHKGLLKTHHAGFMKNGSPYIVMQYIVGQSIQDIVHDERTLSPKKVISIVKSVSSALVYLHKKGIVHRDIKLNNIMCEKNTGNIILMDFGIARTLMDNSNLTVTGSILGTPKFLSPEQASGNELTLKSDVYSLGICLFYMLTGHAPFSASTSMAVVLMHLDTPMPALPKAYQDIQYLLEKMCHKNEALRINAKVLDRELHAILISKQVEQWPTIKYETGKEFIEEHYRTLQQQKIDTEITLINNQRNKKILVPLVLAILLIAGGTYYFYPNLFSKPDVITVSKQEIVFVPSKNDAKLYLDETFIGNGTSSHFYLDKASHVIEAIKTTLDPKQRWYGKHTVNFANNLQKFNIDMEKQYLVEGIWIQEADYLADQNKIKRLAYINNIEKFLNQQKFFGEYDKNAFNQLEAFKDDFVGDIQPVEMTDVFRIKLLSTLNVKIDNVEFKSARSLIAKIENHWYNPNITIDAKKRMRAIERQWRLAAQRSKKKVVVAKKAPPPPPPPKPKIQYNRVCEKCPTMTAISKGTFIFGNNRYSRDEKPSSEQTVGAFYVSETLISNDFFAQFLNDANIPKGVSWFSHESSQIYNDGNTWQAKKGYGDHPVTGINLDGAIKYTDYLSVKGRKKYAIPTELQWEYVASAGIKADFWWGSKGNANLANALGKKDRDQYSSTSPVDTFPKNPFNVHDSVGNVWQWTSSEYLPYSTGAFKTQLKNIGSNKKVSIRGGSYLNSFDQLRASNRSATTALSLSARIGFRVIYTN